jgi:hypothetical protein
MPIPLKNLRLETLENRLDKFRRTIPVGQGFEIEELVQTIGGSYAHISKTIREKNWGLRIINGRHRMAIILVNPKDIPKNAHQTR